MNIEVRRYRYRKETIDGFLYIDGRKVCDCAENAHHCLEPGEYQLSYVKCKRKARCVPLIGPKGCDMDCSQCSRIERGNGVYHRTNGCILVGEHLVPGCLIRSKVAYDALCERIRKSLKRGHDISFRIKGTPPHKTNKQIKLQL